MNWSEVQIWPVLAGLGLFLFGMYMMEEAIRKLSGRAFKLYLRKFTGHPVKAVAAGALVTSILQSSSMVVLLVMSFTGAGIIGMTNGIGMILGVNLGTTITGWLVTLLGFKLNIAAYIMPLIAIGGLGIIFLKKEYLSNISKLIMAVSFIFLGLSYMKDGFEAFAASFDATMLQGQPNILFFLVALLLTAAIQSSSAAMMIILTSLSTNMIDLKQAMFMVVGADLGTTITAIIGTLGGNVAKKRVGYAQFFFNAFNAIFGLALLGVWHGVLAEVDPLFALVAFHSILNLTGIVLMLPFLKYFAAFIKRVIQVKEQHYAANLVLANPAEPLASIEALQTEMQAFIKTSITQHQKMFAEKFVQADYEMLQKYEAEILKFYMKVQQSQLAEPESERLIRLISAARNVSMSAKYLKDVLHNLHQMASAVDEDMFNLRKQIANRQTEFYQSVLDWLEHDSRLPEDLKKMDEFQELQFKQGTDMIYGLYRDRKQEMGISSALNVMREVNSSNECVLRALVLINSKPTV
jgi:phosphate:Na+ symporter